MRVLESVKVLEWALGRAHMLAFLAVAKVLVDKSNSKATD
jgi:hypothetical protein